MILYYELRDGPDDFPTSICHTLAEAERKAWKRAERTGYGPILIYEMRSDGEFYVGAVG